MVVLPICVLASPSGFKPPLCGSQVDANTWPWRFPPWLPLLQLKKETPWRQGMGEPLNNYVAVRDAVAMMINTNAFGLRRSAVTVSTVGVVPRILQLVRSHCNSWRTGHNACTSVLLILHSPKFQWANVSDSVPGL